MLLAPFNFDLRNYDLAPMRPRYHQHITVQPAPERHRQGRKRILLTLATCTGEPMVAFQLVATAMKASASRSPCAASCPASGPGALIANTS
jgi:type I site-specific restriction endonuclease